MEQQPNSKPDLFGWTPPRAAGKYPAAPGYKGERGGPSHTAATAIAPAVKGMQAKVLAVLSKGESLTADEIATRLERSQFSIRPRVAELHKLGLITRADERGQNESGMTASRWRAAQ